MITVEVAQERILSQISSLGIEIVDLAHASGRVLAQALHSKVALPQSHYPSDIAQPSLLDQKIPLI